MMVIVMLGEEMRSLGAWLLGSIFAEYVPLASQSLCLIQVYYIGQKFIGPILDTFGQKYFLQSQHCYFLFMHLPYKAFKLNYPEIN